jgi:hypothetical protein
MNEKLKNILHTGWTEPRHFFFWLGLLSICGFAAAAVGITLAGPALLLAFIVLACILCFAVSVLAFILAWIPPVREVFAWLLGRRFLVLACLATLVVLFYAVEDWRGRHAWQTFKREREARGEHFDLASFVPPQVPDDQNFFNTPLWNDMHFVKTNGSVVWSDTNWGNHVIFSIYGPDSSRAPSPSTWTKAQHVNLAAWQAFYRGASNEVSAVAGLDQAARQAFQRRYGLWGSPASPATNYFPVAKEPQTPAADVLLALSRFETNREILLASCSRPSARFWANYDDGPGTLLPHLARVKRCAQYLSLHANAALKAGDRETALEDLKAAFRLLDCIRREPTLIAQLVRIAALHLALQPVWEGLADRQWTDAELSVIEGELGKLDFLADYEFSMRAERACCELWAVDYVHKAGLKGLHELGENQCPDSAELGVALFRLIPAGWFDQNKVSLCRLQENYILPVVDLQRRVVSPDTAANSQSVLEQLRMRPYDALSKMLVPSLAGSAERFAYGQTAADLARVACALERYRLANGQFPETLPGLAPKFIETLPHDLINGQPLKYRRTDDGQFVLYSVGWNETDDGGQVALTKSGITDINKGDWVWRYPTERESRSASHGTASLSRGITTLPGP